LTYVLLFGVLVCQNNFVEAMKKMSKPKNPHFVVNIEEVRLLNDFGAFSCL